MPYFVSFCPQFVVMSSSGSGGRIRVKDDSFASIGADVAVRIEHTSALNDTKQLENAKKTQSKHRNHLKYLIDWWRTEYPDYFEAGTKVLSQRDQVNPMLFFHMCD
jgi:hypothetical protein